jgi:DNA-binding protein HU-beta
MFAARGARAATPSPPYRIAENRMNRAELVEALVERTELSKKDANNAIAAMFDASEGIIARAMKKGDRVAITGFGVFGVGKRAARTARNPQTGAAIKVAAAKVPKFKAGASLKAVVNGKAVAKKSAGRAAGGRAKAKTKSAGGRRR